MIFDEDGFEYDPCWDCPHWKDGYGCSCNSHCPIDDLID